MTRAGKPPTERGWADAPDWVKMLDAMPRPGPHSRAKLARRKLRLLATAAARAVWAELTDDRSRKAVEAAERYADGLIGARVLTSARADADRAVRELKDEAKRLADWRPWANAGWTRETVDPTLLRHRAVLAAEMAVDAARDDARPDRFGIAVSIASDLVLPLDVFFRKRYEAGRRWTEPPLFADLVRDVYGYPFAPVRFDKRWQTAAVLGVSDAVVVDGAWDRLPILADALEDAGCDDPTLLDHLRGPGPHVRGCWAVDAVRGVHWQPRAAKRA